ncbi:capsular polysaccharide biosynthesis protein [Celeribacter sp.]|uniref:capsular polysaccharide biosynthesis protein n=1 Tax=Celeribacter sp. TaxID=1890673 RepID=UPI003A93E9FD
MSDKHDAPPNVAGRGAFDAALTAPSNAALRRAVVTHPRAQSAAWLGAAPLWADGCAFGVWTDGTANPLDGAERSEFEAALREAPLDDTALLDRARAGIEWWVTSQIHKFSTDHSDDALPNVPFVLLLDQSKDDARLGTSGNSSADLREILIFARTELLNAHVVILTAENGHFTEEDAGPNVTLLPATANPWPLFERATAVYTHSAEAGFCALLAGHRPRVFGTPWYAGWGLTQDENPSPYRGRNLTRAQLFAAAMIEQALWFHPDTGTQIEFEHAMAIAEARHRAARQDSDGYVITGLARWKHQFMRRYFGRNSATISDRPDTVAAAKAFGARHMAWGMDPAADLRVEDGFLRSKGLGAALVPPVSLVVDDLGIYFDPTRASRLEKLITARETLPDHAARRIRAFLTHLHALGLSKYNLEASTTEPLPDGEKILVVGQVEDDASIRLGAGEIATNAALLDAARAAHPDAVIVFKPHPDVEKGLRKGALTPLASKADIVARNADPLTLIDACDHVWTMTSLMGFEALLRGKDVTVTGTPFYAGWGLTRDLGRVPARRAARPSLDALAHAALIDYPRYFNPETGAAISPECALDMLATHTQGRSGIAVKALSILLKLRDSIR